MRLYHCDRKVLLRFQNQAEKFIKDYSTNVLTASKNAFVDGKGRIVAVFDQHQISEDEIWAVVEKSAVERLLSHLSKYLYITEVKVEKEEGMGIYWDLDNEVEPPTKEDVFIPQRAGRLWLTRSNPKINVLTDEMTRFRITHQIPWQDIDFHDELLLCVGNQDYVSYVKGCYLGQEIIARVHYKGRPPKKLVVKSWRDCDDEQKAAMTSRIKDLSLGEDVGFVFDKTPNDV